MLSTSFAALAATMDACTSFGADDPLDASTPDALAAETSPASDAGDASDERVFVARDHFQRELANGFGVADLGGQWVVNGHSPSVANGEGVFSPKGVGTSAFASLSPTVRDVELAVTWRSNWRPTGGIFLTLRARNNAGQADYLATLTWRPDTEATGLSVTVPNPDGGKGIATSIPLGAQLVDPAPARVRFQIVGSNPTTLRAKVWSLSQSEPAAWTIEIENSEPRVQGPGSFGLEAYLSGLANVDAGKVPAQITIDHFEAIDLSPK